MKNSHICLFIILVACIIGAISQEDPKLIYVQEVFRHGHRYPIYSSKADGSSYIDDIRSSG